MDQCQFFLTDNPDVQARRLIDERLGDYNAQHADNWDSRPLAVLVRDWSSFSIRRGRRPIRCTGR